MKYRKHIALLLASLVFILGFAGCSSESSDSGSSSGSASVSDASAGTDDKKASESSESSESTDKNESSKKSEEEGSLNVSAKKDLIYKYICDNFGKVMLSCQQESTWMGSPDYEMDYIKETTGKLPAMRGLDFMNNDFNGVVSRSIAWDAKGGLVTICWHTGVNGSGYQESLDDNPDFTKLLTEGTAEYEAMIKSWDRAAKALARLRDANVPVLWRPFHEFDGQWFWWGKGGKDNFIKLWRLMHDKFTNEYKLDNLIWVLGYSGEVKDGWYPGDEYVDITGSDTYDNSTNLRAWKKLLKVAGKPMAFHECGNVPAVEKFEKDGDLWSWFMIWHTDYITKNDKENLKKVFSSDKVITLDELPDFDNGGSANKTKAETEKRMKKYEDLITTVPAANYDKAEDGTEYPGFKKYTYYSNTAERDTNVNVLLPLNYSTDKKYPVLYILHGFYDSEEWMARKVVALSEILTNLQKKGEAEEMIVVLPYIYCSKENQYVTGMDLENCLAYDNFINDLTTDLMPFIEKTFSVATGRENTAITGFSMGGRESLFIGFKHPELFSYIGAVCPAPGLVDVNGSGMHPGQMEASEMVFPEDEKPAVLLISSSKADGTVTTFPDSYRNILTSNNEEFISQVMATTGHDHTSVKPHLYCFFKMLFR